MAAVPTSRRRTRLAVDATPEERHRPCISFTSPSPTAGRCCCTRGSRFRRRSRRRAPTRRRLRRIRICAGIRCEASGWRTPSHRQNRTFLPPPEWNPLASSTDPGLPTEVPAGPWDVAVFENLFPTLTPLAHDPPACDRRDAAWPRRVRSGGVHAGLVRVARDVCRCRSHRAARRRVGASLHRARCTRRRGVRVSVRESRRRGRRDAASSARPDLRVSVRPARRRARAASCSRHYYDRTGAACSTICSTARAGRWPRSA